MKWKQEFQLTSANIVAIAHWLSTLLKCIDQVAFCFRAKSSRKLGEGKDVLFLLLVSLVFQGFLYAFCVLELWPFFSERPSYLFFFYLTIKKSSLIEYPCSQKWNEVVLQSTRCINASMREGFTSVGSTCNQVLIKWNRECWLSNANVGEALVPKKT